ncbi:MAG: HD domain-containing protein [Bacteroidales bacterium]|nr:HD domain-containing protein [Bacteroidales bacterium]
MEYLSEYVIKAMALVKGAHAGQKDKGGHDYFLHPFTVAMAVAKNGGTDAAITTAILHDVVEDTDYTLARLNDMGFPKEVITALSLLTHDPSVPYMTYVKGVKANPIARQVKMADLLHNLDASRLPHPTEKDLARWEKYRQALKLLQDAQER